jgi:5-formyltetrahydrofolate cyclo-ligase
MISTKKSLRPVYFEKRQQLENQQVEEMTACIASHLPALLCNASINFLHVFLPIHGKNEIDTLELVRLLKLTNPKLTLAAPRVIPGTRHLRHYILDEETVLVDNRWGIPEPDPESSIHVVPAELDAVLVPLLAFDQRGFRVGYGGGFYDRFLAACRRDVLKIGLSFFDPVERIEDIDEYDITLDYCITPREVWRW